MAVRRIFSDFSAVLRGRAQPVEIIDKIIITLLDDMVETMYDAKGVGLAAPQIGIPKRLIVIDCEDENVMQLVNPVILEAEGSCTDVEGCLSIPQVFGEVSRAQRVKVRALNRQGSEVVFEAQDLLARILQHEIDHLDGILFVDRATRMVDPSELERGKQ